jgi:hypothetical protein
VDQQACWTGLEGIVSKRLSAPYRSDPSRDWIKVKNPDSPAMQRRGRGDLAGLMPRQTPERDDAFFGRAAPIAARRGSPLSGWRRTTARHPVDWIRATTGFPRRAAQSRPHGRSHEGPGRAKIAREARSSGRNGGFRGRRDSNSAESTSWPPVGTHRLPVGADLVASDLASGLHRLQQSAHAAIAITASC